MKMFNKLILILLPFCLFSQQNLFDKELFVVEEDTLRYRVLAPLDYEKDKKYPVHLVLHGSGERGNDNESQLIHGSNLFLKENNRKKYPSFVIFPQSPKNDWWGGHYDPYKFDYQVKNSKALKLVINFMDEFIMRSDVNKNKIYGA